MRTWTWGMPLLHRCLRKALFQGLRLGGGVLGRARWGQAIETWILLLTLAQSSEARPTCTCPP